MRAARVFGMDPAQKEKSIGSVAVNSGKYQKHTAKQYFLCRPIHQISNFIIATERYQKMRWYPERCGKMSTPGSPTRTTQLVLLEPQCRQFCECAELVRDGPCNSNDNGPKSQIRICHPHRHNHRKSPKVTSLVKRLNDQRNNTHH